MSERKPHLSLLPSGLPATAQTAIGATTILIFQVAGAVLATALAAHARVWVPGSPVPITLQTLAVLLVGFALGARLAPAAMLLYLILGVVGLPLFAVGGIGPTAGYLVGFVFAAAFVGRFGLAGRGSWLRTTLAATGGTALIFAFGVTWLAVWLRGDVSTASVVGLVPFWPGAVLKIAVAVAAVRAWRLTIGLRSGR